MEKNKVLVPGYLCSHPCVYTLTHIQRERLREREREGGGGMFEKLKHHCTKSILSPPADWVQMHQYFFSSLGHTAVWRNHAKRDDAVNKETQCKVKKKTYYYWWTSLTTKSCESVDTSRVHRTQLIYRRNGWFIEETDVPEPTTHSKEWRMFLIGKAWGQPVGEPMMDAVRVFSQSRGRLRGKFVTRVLHPVQHT